MRNAGVFLLLLVSAMAAAQPRTSETIEVSIVNLDVVVTDKQGNRVQGLTAADFEVREAGKVQPITNFAEYTPAAKSDASVSVEAAPAEAAAVPRRPRTIIVFVEWSRLAPFHAKQMFDSVRTMLRETVEPGDRATIVTWHRKVHVRQPFTDDLQKLNAVLEQLEQEQIHGPRDLSGDVRRDQAESDSDAAVMEAGGMPPIHVLDAAKRERAWIRQKTDVLEALMNSVSGAEGRKILIMAMRRFGLFAGAEFFLGGGGKIPAERRRELSTEEYRDRLIRTANANNVALYPIYPTGLKWAGVPDSVLTLEADAHESTVLFNEATALQELADGTGGLMAWGAGNIAEMLPRVVDDLETYYSLGYRAPATGKDRVRKIEVRAKNAAYEVRTRTQFVEKSDETRMKDRLIANLYQNLGESKIPFAVTLGELRKTSRNRWELPVKVRIPIAALTTLPRGAQESGEFSVYVVTGANVGVMSEVQHKTQPFNIPRADLARAKASHFTYDVVVQVDEKVDRLSVGVVDETAKELGVKLIVLPNRNTETASKP